MIKSSERPETGKIVKVARGYLGVKFVHQGRCRAGIDCIGLVVKSGNEAGYVVEDHTVYGRCPRPDHLLHHIGLSFEQIPIEDAGVEDILLFWVRKPHLPQHAGIISKDGWLIHTWSDVGKVVETPLDDYWVKRTHSAWKYKQWQQ